MSLSLKLLLLALFVFCMILMGSNLKKRRKKILFFGDSITEFGTRPGGYISFISEFIRDADLVEKVEIINGGKAGDKVYDLSLRLQQDVLNREPKVVVLFIGVNDIWHKQKHGTGTSLQTFIEFYESLLHQMQNAGIKMVACTPAIIGESSTQNEYEWKELSEYAAAIKQAASHFDVPVVDLHAAFKNYYSEKNVENIDEGVLTTDGVHLNVAGNKLVAEEIWKLLKHFI